MSWFGDFGGLCLSACVPLPSCNLLSWNNQSVSLHDSVSASASDLLTVQGQCLLNGSTLQVRDLGTAIVTLMGFIVVLHQVFCRPRRMFSAVGRIEMTVLVVLYGCILLLQFFTIGGVLPGHKTFNIWASALHLGVIVCFFWTLIINALILFQFVEDGTRYIIQFIIWTNVAWMVGVTYMSLDLAMDLTGYHHQGHSAGLFFLTIIFPGIAVMLYAILVIVVVYQQLDRHWVLKYVYMALFTFAVSQVTLFVASSKIAQSTHGHVNGSMFSSLLDMLSFFLVYRFWHKITDDTWGDCTV